jgi:hypothetical protein
MDNPKDFDYEDLSEMTIDYNKLKNCTEMLAVTRLLAASLQTNPYMRVGKFIKELSDSDLLILREICEEGESHTRFEELLLISEMLAKAEGLTTESIDVMTQRVGMLVMLLTMESLYRKGLIDVFHDNMSFGEDAGDKVIAKPK